MLSWMSEEHRENNMQKNSTRNKDKEGLFLILEEMANISVGLYSGEEEMAIGRG